MIEAIVIGIIALAIGGAIGFLLADRRAKRAAQDVAVRLAIAEQRTGDLAQQFADEQRKAQAVMGEASAAREQAASLHARLEASERNLIDQRRQLDDALVRAQEIITVREHSATLQARLDAADRRFQEHQKLLEATQAQAADAIAAHEQAASLQAQLEATQQNLQEQRKALEETQARAKDAFATVSAEALAKNNEAFIALARQRFAAMSAEATGTLDERKAQIEGLLKPMHELLGQYQVRLSEVEKSRTESYSMLREQLGTLAETQRTLNVQTSQLVSALRRPNARGQWGEIALRRLVELAGMTARCDFTEQTTIESDETRQRPDMIVNLPNNRQIVIDCKAVLDAFLDASAATDEDVRRAHLERHCQQVRSRARELSTKSYWSQFSQSPEYVVMFLPGEAFLYAAVEMDGTLIEDCLKNRVIVATPTTLIALLKAIEFGWRQEDITQNAEEIKKLGQELYERIAILSGHFEKLGGTLGNAMQHYNSAIASLESRVFVTARKFSELGARTAKDVKSLETVDLQPRLLTIDRTETPAGDRDAVQ